MRAQQREATEKRKGRARGTSWGAWRGGAEAQRPKERERPDLCELRGGSQGGEMEEGWAGARTREAAARLLGIDAQLVREGVIPVRLHRIPISHNALRDGRVAAGAREATCGEQPSGLLLPCEAALDQPGAVVDHHGSSLLPAPHASLAANQFKAKIFGLLTKRTTCWLVQRWTARLSDWALEGSSSYFSSDHHEENEGRTPTPHPYPAPTPLFTNQLPSTYYSSPLFSPHPITTLQLSRSLSFSSNTPSPSLLCSLLSSPPLPSLLFFALLSALCSACSLSDLCSALSSLSAFLIPSLTALNDSICRDQERNCLPSTVMRKLSVLCKKVVLQQCASLWMSLSSHPVRGPVLNHFTTETHPRLHQHH